MARKCGNQWAAISSRNIAALLAVLLVALADAGAHPPRKTPGPPDAVAWVSQSGGPCEAPTGECATFVAALTDPLVSTINLVTDVALSTSDFSNYEADQYPLGRNLTITSAPGGPMRSLDLGYVERRVHVKAGVELTFERVCISGARKAIGVVIDLLTGERGAAVILRDLPFYRFAALPASDAVDLATAYARPAAFPGAQRARVLSGGCTEAAPADVLYEDIAIDAGAVAPSKVLEPEQAARSYDQVLLNVTRECSGTPSPECLRVALPEACVLLMTDGYEAGSHKQRSARLGPGATAGVIVGAAAAAVLVAAAAVFAAVRLRRRGGGRGLDCKATIRSVGAADKV